ncbi:MAG TPA: hypothetical protein VGA13_11840 [Acidimicrobiales bacterium]
MAPRPDDDDNADGTRRGARRGGPKRSPKRSATGRPQRTPGGGASQGPKRPQPRGRPARSGEASSTFREARRAVDRARAPRRAGPPPEPEVWIDEGVVPEEPRRRRDQPAPRSRREGARGSRSRGRDEGARRPRPRRSTPRRDGGERADRAWSPDLDAKSAAKLKLVAEAFSEERFGTARSAIRPLLDRWPDVAEVRELAGLIHYRMGEWRAAAGHLAEFARLTGSAEQHPVLADCQRALGHHDRVTELWDELRSASPSAAAVSEGRIVAAGSLADQGDLTAAIALLESAPAPKKAKEHHLRTTYALADLLERSGDLPAARAAFARVVNVDPHFVDAAERLAGLG